MNRSLLITIALVLTGLPVVGLLGTTHGQSHFTHNATASAPESHGDDGVTVVIDNFSFMAPNLTIPAGTKVTWINHDDVPHTIVSTEQKFRSKAVDTDESFSYTFTEPGTYPYFCSIHPKMVANVVVTAKK